MKRFVLLMIIVAAVWMMWPTVVVERFDVPVFATPLSPPISADENGGRSNAEGFFSLQNGLQNDESKQFVDEGDGIEASSTVAAQSSTPPYPLRGLGWNAETPLRPSISADENGGRSELPWLHVVVETKYAWLYQKSVGRAWVTKSRDDSTRVNVGELCIQLDCYWQHKACETDTSYVEIQEIKRRIAVKKKKAFVSAWANQPELEKITVEMEP